MVGSSSVLLKTEEAWRAHPLDGALLFFQPNTGIHIRWDGPETRTLKRRAPRIVMFGITNRCNLSCNFCSRDLHAGSEWDVDSAYEMLAGLASKGVLEVAFGGGEPLAFRGFDELITRLGKDTPLALHFTTNGTLLTHERLMKLKDWIGELRLSIYDDNIWHERVEMLSAAGVRFGVNLLVTPVRLAVLPALLNRLAMLGCRDVALLSYVGADLHLHLSASDEERLATIISDSPIRTKLSVCFGDRLHPLPRLFDGDCGAGDDFAVITSDKKFKSCSFQRSGIDVETPDDVIRVWQEQRERLSPAGLLGCARTSLPAVALSDGIRIWQSFSGNNSGDCVLVGRFKKSEDARKYISDLLPDFESVEPFSENPYPKKWQELLEREGISVNRYEYVPNLMAVVGRTVMLESYSAEDDFPSLRTLLWRRGGRAVYSAIHEHDRVEMIAGIGCGDIKTLESVETDLAVEKIGNFTRRGLDLYGIVEREDSLSDRTALLEKIAEKHNGAISAELVPVGDTVDLPMVLAARPSNDEIERLWVRFHNEAAATAFASKLQGNFKQADKYVIVESERIGSRIGYFAQHLGGVAEIISGNFIRLVLSFWLKDKSVDERDVAASLLPLIRPYLCHQDQLYFEKHGHSVTVEIDSANPCAALDVLVQFARSHSFEIWLEAHPRNRLVDAIVRISSDLKAGLASHTDS
ncbi:MAG: radical SAM protein [Acidobacteriota bacterium]